MRKKLSNGLIGRIPWENMLVDIEGLMTNTTLGTHFPYA